MKTGPPSFPAKKKKASSSEDSTSQAGAGALAAAGAGGGLATLGLRSDEELAELRKNCPPDIEELGRSVASPFSPLYPSESLSQTRLADAFPPSLSSSLLSATWTLLHTLTSSLPSSPSPTQQTHLTALLTSLTILYPCPHCRADFAAKFAAAGGEPALREAVKTREGAERWVWERHEEVNRKLGKEGGVGVGEIRVRWKEGGEGCGW